MLSLSQKNEDRKDGQLEVRTRENHNGNNVHTGGLGGLADATVVLVEEGKLARLLRSEHALLAEGHGDVVAAVRELDDVAAIRALGTWGTRNGERND